MNCSYEAECLPRINGVPNSDGEIHYPGGNLRVIRIVTPTPTLVKFLTMLHLKLSEPQRDHLERTMDGLIACESTKTLSVLTRLFWEAPDPSNLADFFRDSPWDEKQL